MEEDGKQLSTAEIVKAVFAANGPLTVSEAGELTRLGSERIRQHITTAHYRRVGVRPRRYRSAVVWELKQEDYEQPT